MCIRDSPGTAVRAGTRVSTADQAGGEATAVAGRVVYQGGRPAGPARPGSSAASAALLRQFPPRPPVGDWSATGHTRSQVMSRSLTEPFLAGSALAQRNRRRGLVRVLGWLEQQPGDSWQDRWLASAADAQGNVAWRRLPARWKTGIPDEAGDSEHVRLNIARAMSLLVCADVLRPSLSWLLTPATPAGLVADLTRGRDPDGFARLTTVWRADGSNTNTARLALRRIAAILAANGGLVSDITVGDCLQLLHTLEQRPAGPGARSPYFYQLLRTAGVFGDNAPTVRGLRTQGQLGCEQLIDRYGIVCRPVRDLLVDYLRERQPGVDYATLHKLSYSLGRLFWRDLEINHPGIDSLRLPAEAVGQFVQGRVVHAGLAFAQVIHEQVAHRPAHDAVAVDQLLTAELALRSQAPYRRRVVTEHPGGAQQLVEVRAARAGSGRALLQGVQQLQAVADGDVADQATVGGQDGRDPA